jgi:hypothetical protein
MASKLIGDVEVRSHNAVWAHHSEEPEENVSHL